MNSSKILLVEDEDIVAGFIEYTLSDHQLGVTRVASAQAAWHALQSPDADFDLILLDRGLPDMDGMDFLHRIKGNHGLKDIPVVMETSHDDIDSIREGLSAGAYYYLTKPLEPKLFLAVVDAALSQHREFIEMKVSLSEAGRALAYLESGVFRFRTLADARGLAQGLARTSSDPGRVVVGLQELLVNAVEHGNLCISYAEKNHLVVEGTWAEEVERRLSMDVYAGRTATVTFRREPDCINLLICDQGDGFEWQKYLEFDPERALHPHGRGIAMARMMSLDSIEYQGNGNTVAVKITTDAISLTSKA